MTLTRRLVLGALFVALALTVGVSAATHRQKTSALAQLDERLERAIPTARAIVKRIENGSRTQKGLEAALSDVWVGRFGVDGRPVTLISPMDDPDLLPQYSRADTTSAPKTTPTASGRTESVRILTVKDHSNEPLILAVSTENIDTTISDLTRINVILVVVILMLLGLMLWWTIVLGASPVRKMTATAIAIAHGEDVSVIEVNRASAESSDLAHALNEMVRTLRNSEQKMKRFVADASHELRTPLTTLRGYSDLYASGALRSEAEVADAMERIRSEADRMNNIINDLLTLRTADEIPPTLEPARLDIIVEQCAGDMRAVQPSRRITVSAPEVETTCDVAAITQCVMAFGMNALQHTPESTAVHMNIDVRDDVVRFEMIDRGDGIEPEHLPRLFERLYRVDPSRIAANNHSGIGLSVVAAIIRAHGGSYGAESQRGIGSTFWFEIPRTPA